MERKNSEFQISSIFIFSITVLVLWLNDLQTTSTHKSNKFQTALFKLCSMSVSFACSSQQTSTLFVADPITWETHENSKEQ